MLNAQVDIPTHLRVDNSKPKRPANKDNEQLFSQLFHLTPDQQTNHQYEESTTSSISFMHPAIPVPVNQAAKNQSTLTKPKRKHKQHQPE